MARPRMLPDASAHTLADAIQVAQYYGRWAVIRDHDLVVATWEPRNEPVPGELADGFMTCFLGRAP